MQGRSRPRSVTLFIAPYSNPPRLFLMQAQQEKTRLILIVAVFLYYQSQLEQKLVAHDHEHTMYPSHHETTSSHDGGLARAPS